MKRPKILITNDDGLFAPGIKHLWSALKEIADLTVVAPLTEQSAVGLSITIRSPLKIESHTWTSDTQVWGVNGTPADCVKLGVTIVSDKQPDLIVSGINRGTNAGRNVLYSGTVGGAIEGVLRDIPSIAFSCYDFSDPDYSLTTAYIEQVVDYVLTHPPTPGTLLNVNFPSKSHAQINGIKMTRQGKEYLLECPDMRKHPTENHTYYWLGARVQAYEEDEDSDITWLAKGYATVVPVHVAELTDHRHLHQHRDQFDKSMSTWTKN